MVYICLDMGWDYHTYMAQPTFFIDQILKYYEDKAKEIKKQKYLNKKR